MDFKKYYHFSKPGIVYANVLTAIAGYLFASRLHIGWQVLIGLVLGLGLLIIGACAANNLIDQKRDARMARTRQRGLVTGAIAPRIAFVYAAVAAVAGLALLATTQNVLTGLLALVAYVDYVVAYGIAKRRTRHGTLVGCISGAIPLVAGYTAYTNRLDVTAWLLFGLMVVWQMAHFFGIALYRLDDYAAASLPVMPVARGAAATKPRVIVYIVLFILFVAALVVHRAQGIIGGLALLLAGVNWLYMAASKYRSLSASAWGKQVFLRSLLVMLVMVASLSLGSRLV